jgi:hypothetical protein
MNSSGIGSTAVLVQRGLLTVEDMGGGNGKVIEQRRLTLKGANAVRHALGIYSSEFSNTRFKDKFGVTRNAVWKYAKYYDQTWQNISLRGIEVIMALFEWVDSLNTEPKTTVDPLEVAMGLPVEVLISALRKRAGGITIHA